MRYSIHEGFYRVWRVTGPTHNLLGLAFTEESVEEVGLDKLCESSKSSIDEELLLHAVLSGVEEANRAHQIHYRLSRVQYVSTDTPDDKVYSYLARMIVERLAKGADFERT